MAWEQIPRVKNGAERPPCGETRPSQCIWVSDMPVFALDYFCIPQNTTCRTPSPPSGSSWKWESQWDVPFSPSQWSKWSWLEQDRCCEEWITSHSPKCTTRLLKRLDECISWARIKFKAALSRSLDYSLQNGLWYDKTNFPLGKDGIPHIIDQPISSLGRLYDLNLSDKNIFK